MNRMMPIGQPRVFDWWADDDLTHGRPSPGNPDVQRLIARISPDAQITDLGGTMSLNLELDPAGLVLRIHQPFVSRERLLAVHAVRRRISQSGLLVPSAVNGTKSTVFRCGNRWAELEEFIPHERLKPTPDSFIHLFGAMGSLHHVLAFIDLPLPGPLVAAYASPATLRRRLTVTELAVQDDTEAALIARRLRTLINRLRSRWIPASRLPTQLVHGDIRLNNIGVNPYGRTVYLDFGFLASRPRIHELAYSLVFMLLALGGSEESDRTAWQMVPQLIEAYEDTAKTTITTVEKKALIPYMAAVPVYHAVHDGFKDDPAKSVQLLHSRQSFLRLSEWLLTHADSTY